MNRNSADDITILRNLFNNELFSAFINSSDGHSASFAIFVNRLMNAEAETNFLGWLQELILIDENAFSVCCAKGKEPSTFLKKAYLNDLKIIFDLALEADAQGLYRLGKCSAPFSEDFNHAETFRNLCVFYKKHGYGKFIRHAAFLYDNDSLFPVDVPARVMLSDLKNYEAEKRIIRSNLENMLKGLPFSDMLLYGDRGTGKSSTVHAMLNNYSEEGLRLIELKKEDLLKLQQIRKSIQSNPLKFIIFIDDLTLNESDDKISSLKASLEGSVYGKNDNSMIIATSNRRHIVKENYSDRENSVHAGDCVQEQLSLSDRFGITVMFSSTDKAQYLSIVKQLAEDKALNICDRELYSIAERWAITKGGRSPRRAKQIVDLLYSCRIKGEPVDF